MKREDERSLEILSDIDDRHLEKATIIRLLLWSKVKKKNNRAWIPWVAMAACLVLVVGAILAILPMLIQPVLPPDDTDTDAPFGKQVPIYQGMTISHEPPTPSENQEDALWLSPEALSSLSITPLNQQDTTTQADTSNQGKQGIDQAVGEHFPAILPEDTEYFAKKNEDIYIYIHLSNPDKFEILSFTLNGKKYSSYMFEPGSDMETLVLKYNVGDVEGTQTYTIDAIKYVDGEFIKDVRMEGDRDVQVHIYPEEQPTANVTNVYCSHISLSLTPTVEDPLGLIAASEGVYYVVLYLGEKIVQQKAFALGNPVTFEELEPDTVYQYAVVALYDAIDGQGKAPHIIYQADIRTKSVVSIEDVTVEGLTATFTLNGAEYVTALGLYEGETLYRELSKDARTVEHLPIDKEVSLVATYGVGDNTYTTTYTLPVIKESEGLLIVNGVIAGIGSCTDTTLYLNHPIGKQAFIDHSFICEAYIGDGVTGIGTRAFRGCTSLTYVEISDSVTNIGSYAFSNCSKLTSVTMGNGVTSIDEGAFYGCSSLTSVIIPDSITSIGAGTFQGCTGLTNITIPDSVTSIGHSAFEKCSSLTSVTIPDSVTSIGYSDTFWMCSSLTSVTIGNSVTYIGYKAFSECSSLTSVTIPNSVKEIDLFAFDECFSLVDVYYTGTKGQWEQIVTNGTIDALKKATIHYEYQP